MSNIQPQCACSAFFETELNLHDHLEEYRSREHRLQAELERCRTHSRVTDDDYPDGRNDPSDGTDEHNTYGKVAVNHMRTIRKSEGPRGHFCPSCKRAKPFPKMQGLRRHFQQHVACEEVCVCCFKVFRLVSEFIRHADKHDGACERKRAFINKTCHELCDQSDKQLTLAMSQDRSEVVVGKKRKCDVAALGSDILGARPDLGRISMAVLDQSFRQINESDSLHQLDSAHTEISAPQIPMQSPIVDAINPSSSRNMPTEELYFNAEEGGTHDLDLLDFDAPILQIMNSVPALTTGWVAQDNIVDITTESVAYQEP